MGIDLLNELEEAAASLVRGSGVWPAANVAAGKSADEKRLPLVICQAEGEGEEDPKGTGNYWVDLRVKVKGHAGREPGAGLADAKAGEVFNVKMVFGVFQGDDLDAQLNAQGRVLTVFPNGWVMGSPTRAQDEDGVWVDEILIRIYCCGAILPP